MYKLGVASVSFRTLSAERIIELASDAGLEVIEWGSDVHAPCRENKRLNEIAKKQGEKNIRCSSYGTYFRLGVNAIEELEWYISAAKRLGTNVLRIWCGNKNYQNLSEAEKAAIIAEGKKAAMIAEKLKAVLCLECHENTFTNCVEGALEIMQCVQSPSFRMYWQPNAYGNVCYNREYARRIAPYVVNLHVLYWTGDTPRQESLSKGFKDWIKYLSCFNSDMTLLLEFMPEDNPEHLKKEAMYLRELVREVTLYKDENRI